MAIMCAAVANSVFKRAYGHVWAGFLAGLILAVLMSGPAQAAGLPGLVSSSNGSSAKSEAPAKPPAPTIIPGSPLAALTGATHAPTAPSAPETRAPFGTQSIGLVLNTALGHGAIDAFGGFIKAIQHSTRLTPAIEWGHAFARSPNRRAEGLAILEGFGKVIVPGIVLDALLAFLLRYPAVFFAKRAAPRADEYLSVLDSNGVRHPQLPLRLSLRGWFRRCGYALLKFLLTLLPLAAFVAFVLFVLSLGFVTNRAAHLAVTGITNAYIFARLAHDVAWLLIAPQTPNLRLIRMPTPYARWTMRRVAILLITIVVSYCLISGAEILGLSDKGGAVLVRLAGLVVHLELAVWVWQCRRVVSRWIAGRTEASGMLAGIRQRFAKIWYIFALFYLIGLWVAWAGGVHDALAVILRAVLVIVGALILVRLLWVGCNRLLERIFPDDEIEDESDVVGFRRRFTSYNPLIRLIVQVLIALLALVVVLQGWGIDAFGWILVNPIGRALVSTVVNVLVTIIAAVLVWEFCNYLLDRQINRFNKTGRTRQATRLSTLRPMVRAALSVVVVMLALIIGLSRIGVNTTGLLAVSSVVGIAVGFGSQKLVQDVITGLFLLFEDAIQVGDSVTLGGITGTVERLSIRTIRLRGGDGSVNIIPFSSVSIVTNQTRDFSMAQLSILVGYHENVDQVVAQLKKIGAEMRADASWSPMIRDDIQIFGLDSFDTLGLMITGQMRTIPGQHAAVRREFQARVQKRFMELGIEQPYRHQTLQLEIPSAVRESVRRDIAALGIAGDKNPAG